MDTEPESIEQAMLQQSLTERTMAIHDKALSVLLLELGHFGRDIAPDDCRVIPISPFQGGREDILTDVVYPVGVVAGSSGLCSSQRTIFKSSTKMAYKTGTINRVTAVASVNPPIWA